MVLSQRIEQILKMERPSVSDESLEVDYHPSSENRNDSSNTDTVCSTPSADSSEYSRTISEISSYSEHSTSDDSLPLCWPIGKPVGHSSPVLAKLRMKQHTDVLNEKQDNGELSDSELELMKERFSKLLLGEDMSGGGKGVCTAITISNAITNLYATVFGQCWRLEPLSPEKKSMWRREMDCLLSVCDYIAEFFPSVQKLPDGSTLEVMATRPRSDIDINLPALEKLDSMLLEILNSFKNTDFWYVDEENVPSTSAEIYKSFRKVIHRNEEKWWLPIPCVPVAGLPDKSQKELQQKRDCSNQIHKAAMAINSSILAEMEVPETYLAALPKSGRKSVGDCIYNYISVAEQFSADHLLNCLDITSEHDALDIADHIEAAMYVWRRKASMDNWKSSWGMVKDLMTDGDKNVMLAIRAETLLLCLKQRFPGLSQTTLDSCKIQYNKDVGQAILESYSRVLESLAFKIVTWIEDILHIDGSVKKNCIAENKEDGVAVIRLKIF